MPTMRLSSGIKLDYVDSGVGIPLVFVHGYTGGKWNWEPQLRYFTAGYQTVAYDHKGHGESEKPLESVYSVAQYAQELDEFLDHLGFEEEVFLIGHSMGGATVLTYALEYQDKRHIDGLVVMGAGAAMGDEQSQPLIDNWLGVLKANYDKGVTMPEEQGLQFARMAFGPDFQDDALVRRSFDEGQKVPDKIRVELLEAMVRDFDVSGRLGEITMPVSVIVGEKDFARTGAEALAGGLPHAEFHTLPKVGHMLTWEAPDAVNQLIEEFVQKHAD